jgi:ABC-2 type transport system permease protein/oleandomycin transport system permease protein
MSATTVPTRPTSAPAPTGFGWTFRDGWVVTKRNLTRYSRSPQLVVFSTIQPVMFVLLFTYVFGGAVALPVDGLSYVDFLLPGVLAQSALFSSTNTGIALNDDLTKGIVDRFRSLPMARSAVLVGRTLADAARMLFVTLLMIGVGFLVGFRLHGSLAAAAAAVALMVLFGFAFSWISANIGLRARDAETAQTAGFVWLFPLVFASSVFVPAQSITLGWLRAFAENSPVTATVNAVRGLLLGPDLAAQLGIGDVSDAVVKALLWSAGILVIAVPLAVRGYRKTA